MSKLIVFVSAAICYANAIPANSNAYANANADAEVIKNKNNFGNIPEFGNYNFQQPQFPQIQIPQIPDIKFPEMPKITFPVIPTIKPITPEDIKNMKPGPGGYIDAVSETITSHTEVVNGQPVTKISGQRTTNVNGKISTTNF